MRERLRTLVRSIAIGWATLLAIGYLLVRPLLYWTAPVVGANWFPTVQLSLSCLAMAGTGWIVGYLNRSSAVIGVLVFAATLTPWDFGPVLAINVPGLVRLMVDALSDPRYFDSLITTAGAHTLLFGSLIAGGLLLRPSDTNPPSIVGAVPPGT
jgi:hypothetical protein